MLTIPDRIAAFRGAFPKRPASWPWLVQEQGHDVLYARWVIGARFSNETRYHGAYPRGFLPRVLALFPDVVARQASGELVLLHAFSGSVPAGAYLRCDLIQPSELQGSVYDLALRTKARFALQLADPPYTQRDAKRYGTPPVNRRRATAALAAVAESQGFLVWLDVTWPMHRKDQWRTVGRIALTRSTGHIIRDVTIFQRVA